MPAEVGTPHICLRERLFFLYIPTKHGVVPTSEGCIPTSEGVILTKQANFRPYFARTGTLQHEKFAGIPILPIKTTCFCNFCDIHSYPNYMSTGSGRFVPQSSCLHLARPWKNNTQKKECRQDACGTRKAFPMQWGELELVSV